MVDRIKELLGRKSCKVIIVSIICNIFLVCGIVYSSKAKTDEVMELEKSQNFEISQNNQEMMVKLEEPEEKIKIHVSGEVKNPGVYELNIDSRIIDVIEASGGTTDLANLENVNLAYKISDGQKIKIPSINDENVGNDNINEENLFIIGNIGNEKVNINTATIQELTKVTGIGESTAKKIVDYREKNGRFKEIEDIKNVSGIGDSKYNQIKDYIKTK